MKVTLDTQAVKRYTPAKLSRGVDMDRETPPQRIPIRELVRYYLRLGLVGFGGPVALVGQMERELVGERKWLTKEEMREGIAVCQSLPGPLAIQVGIWISYIRGGFWGAWAGGWAFILPNFVIVTVLGALYVHWGGLSAVKAIFYGVSPAVIALILHSCYRLTKLGMKDWLEWALAAAAFVITVAVQRGGRASVHRLRRHRRAVLRLTVPGPQGGGRPRARCSRPRRWSRRARPQAASAPCSASCSPSSSRLDR